MLPTNPKDRKEHPITTGVLDYFPNAIAAIAHVSFVGNEQHNPGQSMHWNRHKSTDQADCIARHLLERGKIDSDGLRHTAKMAWRALALLQLELEAEVQNKKDTPVRGNFQDSSNAPLPQVEYGVPYRLASDPDSKHRWTGYYAGKVYFWIHKEGETCPTYDSLLFAGGHFADAIAQGRLVKA